MRNITEILKDADALPTWKNCKCLWEEIIENKKKYSLIELRFAKEHLENVSPIILEKEKQEMSQRAKELMSTFEFLKWDCLCDLCGSRNCKSNDNCISCNNPLSPK